MEPNRPSITILGSWVTSLEHLRELVSLLPAWDLHPEVIVAHVFSIDEADAAYRLDAGGQSGRVAPVP